MIISKTILNKMQPFITAINEFLSQSAKDDKEGTSSHSWLAEMGSEMPVFQDRYDHLSGRIGLSPASLHPYLKFCIIRGLLV